jgi:hypothetical protein
MKNSDIWPVLLALVFTACTAILHGMGVIGGG